MLQSSKEQHDAEIARQQGILENLRKLPRPGPLVLDHAPANRAIQPLNDRTAENERQLDGSNIGKFMRPVKEVLPTALWILALALLSPLLVKAIAYYVIAPIAARRAPVCLLPRMSGEFSTATRETNRVRLRHPGCHCRCRWMSARNCWSCPVICRECRSLRKAIPSGCSTGRCR